MDGKVNKKILSFSKLKLPDHNFY